jgi:flavin-dependent dehydrogenase
VDYEWHTAADRQLLYKVAMIEEFDVLVAGGGPAGAVVAMCLARQGCRVALLEATAYDLPRYGETLPPEINPVLRSLGLWEAFQSLSPLEASGMISLWGGPLPVEVDFIGNVHGPGWHIDRRQFDGMLVNEAARAGVRIYPHCRVGACCREDNRWSVGECRSRVLVDARGRNGLRLDGNANRETEDVLLAIALTISYSARLPRDLRTCIETTSCGWWYSAPLPEGTAIAMFFTDPNIYRRDGISIHEQLKAAPFTARRLEDGQIQDSRVLHVTSSCRTAIFGNGWLAVGDSASSYDPLSGRGVFKALRNASSATPVITACLHGETGSMASYASQVRLEFDEYVRQRRLYYAIEQRWSEHAFWQARHR